MGFTLNIFLFIENNLWRIYRNRSGNNIPLFCLIVEVKIIKSGRAEPQSCSFGRTYWYQRSIFSRTQASAWKNPVLFSVLCMHDVVAFQLIITMVDCNQPASAQMKKLRIAFYWCWTICVSIFPTAQIIASDVHPHQLLGHLDIKKVVHLCHRLPIDEWSHFSYFSQIRNLDYFKTYI